MSLKGSCAVEVWPQAQQRTSERSKPLNTKSTRAAVGPSSGGRLAAAQTKGQTGARLLNIYCAQSSMGASIHTDSWHSAQHQHASPTNGHIRAAPGSIRANVLAMSFRAGLTFCVSLRFRCCPTADGCLIPTQVTTRTRLLLLLALRVKRPPIKPAAARLLLRLV